MTVQCVSAGAPVFVERLHDVVAEEGGSLTLECRSPSSKTQAYSPQYRAPDFVTQLEDHEVRQPHSRPAASVENDKNDLIE